MVKAAKNLRYQDLDTALECYGNDFDASRLSTQLQLFTTAMAEFNQSDICIPFIKSHFQSMSSAMQTNFSRVMHFTEADYGDTSHQFCF